MADVNRVENKEKPFEGKKVYFSGSIKGVPHPDPQFFFNLINFMIESGADVLSEHVGGRNLDEVEAIRKRRTGVDINEIPSPWFKVRKMDIDWVDEADYLVAVVDSPSTGTGMEIQEALRKHKMGMKLTPVLCLVHKNNYDGKLTFMAKGISENDSPAAEVRTYENTKDAERIITDFLLRY